MSVKMKLGWWRDRGGREHEIDVYAHYTEWPWRSVRSGGCWRNSGQHCDSQTESDFDLIEFLRPLEDLPPALNSAVKAAEDRVLDLKKHYGAAHDVAEEARRMWEEAKRELERLEKECEVGE